MPHKLLLADDSVTIQRVIELTFADEDVQVTVVGDGRRAIEQLKADRPDIVLADIGMPEKDGYEVSAFVKGDPQLAHIPVVLLTGAFEPLDENRARSVGCDGVLVKPFEPQMVINRVRELLAGQRPVAAMSPPPPPIQTSVPDLDMKEDFDALFAPSSPPPPPAPAPALSSSKPPLSTPMSPPLSTRAAAEPEKPPVESLDDYFDRLDAAFATIGAPPGAERPEPDRLDLSGGIGELHHPPPQAPSADALDSWDPELVGDLAPGRQPHLATAFAALLAAEEGFGAPLGAAVMAPPEHLSDDTIEEIVRRVIARMSDDTVRRTVVETAERLVREEIERIKRGTNQGR